MLIWWSFFCLMRSCSTVGSFSSNQLCCVATNRVLKEWIFPLMYLHCWETLQGHPEGFHLLALTVNTLPHHIFTHDGNFLAFFIFQFQIRSALLLHSWRSKKKINFCNWILSTLAQVSLRTQQGPCGEVNLQLSALKDILIPSPIICGLRLKPWVIKEAPL